MDIVTQLQALTSLNAGDPAPAILCGVDNWPGIVAKIAQDAFDEIQRLRGGYPADLDDVVTKLRTIAAEDIGDGLAPTPVLLLREAANAINRLRGVVTKLENEIESERLHQDCDL